jgi:nitrogen regulatory protein PII
MKKIEATIDPVALDAIWRLLAEAGIDGRLTVTEVRLENLGRFYERETTAENPWKPRLRLDLIVSDRQTESAVDVILRQAKLAGGRGTGGYIDILSLDATLEISPGELCQPSKERRISHAVGKQITDCGEIQPAHDPREESSEQKEVPGSECPSKHSVNP